MTKKDFIFLHVADLLSVEHRSASEGERWRKLAATFSKTIVSFYLNTGLLKTDPVATLANPEKVVLRLSDLTEEGQDFLLWDKGRWLGACDRKSNDLLRKGATEKERLAVYADPKGLYRRLDKFRKERASKAN